MQRSSPFPPVELADEHGLLAVGGDTSPEMLLCAYRQGIFPWPMDEDLLTWFAPNKRALLFFENLHIPRSLWRTIKKERFTVRINHNFDAVISSCQTSPNRVGQSGTWITSQIHRGYSQLHQSGHAHSVEAYCDGTLAGGLYGVSIGGMFAGESMFYREPDASKVCLIFLCALLSSLGVRWLDCQVMTSLLEGFGATEVPREEFSELLTAALNKPALELPSLVDPCIVREAFSTQS